MVVGGWISLLCPPPPTTTASLDRPLRPAALMRPEPRAHPQVTSLVKTTRSNAALIDPNFGIFPANIREFFAVRPLLALGQESV
jgi:hypothetical protein